MVGKSICGSEDTGSWKKQTIPTKRKAAAIKDVATGRLMKGLDRLTGSANSRSPRNHGRLIHRPLGAG